MLFIVILTIYLGALIAVGAIKASQIKTQEDFSLAGRKLPTFVLVGTLLATWIGTGSIFGNAQETFRVGMPAFILPIAGGLGIIALYFLAARVRRANHFTIQDILEDRFGPWARILGTLTLFMAYVIIVSYQYRAGSAVLGYIFPDLNNELAIVLVAVFVIIYTVLAGMYSVAYTDVANGILMTLGLGLALPILFSKAGGLEGISQALLPQQGQLFGHYSLGALISILLPSFLLLLGDANMYGRFFSAESPEAAKKSAAWMLLGVVALECAIIAIALIGLSLVNQGALTTPENTGHIVIHLAFNALPQWLGAILVATVVAVVVSTADSYLLAPSSAMVRDVYQRFLNPNADEKRIVMLSRMSVVALGLIALGLAFTSDEFFYVALFAYTLYGAAITPVLMAALFWPKATKQGAIAAMTAGLLSAIGWQFVIANGLFVEFTSPGFIQTSLITLKDSGVDAVVPACIINITVLVGVSLATDKTA